MHGGDSLLDGGIEVSRCLAAAGSAPTVPNPAKAASTVTRPARKRPRVFTRSLSRRRTFPLSRLIFWSLAGPNRARRNRGRLIDTVMRPDHINMIEAALPQATTALSDIRYVVITHTTTLLIQGTSPRSLAGRLRRGLCWRRRSVRLPWRCLWSYDAVGMSRTSCRDIPTVARAAYGLVSGLSFRTKMLAGSDPWVMAKNGNTAAPLEPSPS
jgi:hypothetical protein